MQKLVEHYLMANPNTDVCDACLAHGAAVPLEQASRAAAALARSGLFLRDYWRCSRCRVESTVTRSLANRAVTELARRRASLSSAA